MSEIPIAVMDRLASERKKPVSIAGSLHIQRGDLRVVESLSHERVDSRIMLVLAVDPQHEFADVVLVHSAPELATEADVVVPKDVSSAPYDLVIETDLRAVVWTLQISRAIGYLDESTLSAINSIGQDDALVQDDGMGPNGTVSTPLLKSGIQLTGPADPRWAFKVDEGHSLRDLAHDSTRALLEKEMVWQLEPELIHSDVVAHANDPTEFLAELAHWLGTRKVALTESSLEELNEMGVQLLDAWGSVSDLGLDLLTLLEDVVLRSTTTSGSGSEIVTGWLSAAHLRQGTDGAKALDVHYLGLKEASVNG